MQPMTVFLIFVIILLASFLGGVLQVYLNHIKNQFGIGRKYWIAVSFIIGALITLLFVILLWSN